MAIPLPGTPIIVDIGSAYTKIGFAGEPSPRFVFPTITGTEKYKAVMVDVSGRNIYIGLDASKMRGVLKIKHPIERGAIMDWNDYYEILNYIFYSLLRIENLSNYPVLYTEPPFVQRETKEYIARVLYETHRVKSLIMIPTPILSLFSVGLTTGIVIESGDGITWVCPILGGEIVDQAVQKLTLAGTDVNQHLKNLLMREDKYYWSDLLSHIMISGGNLSYSGFEERLRLELTRLIPQLGKIPKPKIIKPSREERQKMRSKKKSQKKEDTCPHCGTLVDLTDGKEFCPSCNGRIVLPELSIGNFNIGKKPKIDKGKITCPNCKKAVEDPASIFCPYCGETFPPLEISDIPLEIIKNTPPAREFSGFYESSEQILRFFVPENLQFAIFNGASILGSLASFQSLFVTHEQFQTNSAALYNNICNIVNYFNVKHYASSISKNPSESFSRFYLRTSRSKRKFWRFTSRHS
jgi:actin-related protein